MALLPSVIGFSRDSTFQPTIYRARYHWRTVVSKVAACCCGIYRGRPSRRAGSRTLGHGGYFHLRVEKSLLYIQAEEGV